LSPGEAATAVQELVSNGGPLYPHYLRGWLAGATRELIGASGALLKPSDPTARAYYTMGEADGGALPPLRSPAEAFRAAAQGAPPEQPQDLYRLYRSVVMLAARGNRRPKDLAALIRAADRKDPAVKAALLLAGLQAERGEAAHGANDFAPPVAELRSCAGPWGGLWPTFVDGWLSRLFAVPLSDESYDTSDDGGEGLFPPSDAPYELLAYRRGAEGGTGPTPCEFAAWARSQWGAAPREITAELREQWELHQRVGVAVRDGHLTDLAELLQEQPGTPAELLAIAATAGVQGPLPLEAFAAELAMITMQAVLGEATEDAELAALAEDCEPDALWLRGYCDAALGFLLSQGDLAGLDMGGTFKLTPAATAKERQAWGDGYRAGARRS